MYPDRGTFVPCSGYITARDQSMVESGVTEGRKNTASFFFVNEHDNTNVKSQAKKQLFLKLSQKRNSCSYSGGKRWR